MDRQITPSVVVSLGYVGSVSNDLVAAGGNTGNTAYGNDVNLFAGDLIQHINCQLTGTASNQTSTCTGVQTRLNTSFGSINYSYNAAHGNYNGLIASGRGRLGQKAFFTASYTLGHGLDNWQNYPFGYPISQFYASNPYDIRHRVSLGASYDLPGEHLGNHFARRIAGGFTLAGLAVVQTGPPFTVSTSAPFRASLINPALPATASNLQFAPGSGDYNADGDNFDFPNVVSYGHHRESEV